MGQQCLIPCTRDGYRDWKTLDRERVNSSIFSLVKVKKMKEVVVEESISQHRIGNSFNVSRKAAFLYGGTDLRCETTSGRVGAEHPPISSSPSAPLAGHGGS
jgi:hypothetical protein